MKTLRSRLLICNCLFLTVFFGIGIVFVFSDEVTIFRGIEIFLFTGVFAYLGVSTKIELHEDYINFFQFWKKKKLSYSDVVSICCGSTPGRYLITDFCAEKYILYFPFEHKKMITIFKTIEKSNPNVQINVWWYKNGEKNEFRKVAFKWGIFILAIAVADILYHIVIKK